MKTCPICGAKAAPFAATCFECYYRFSDMSTRDVREELPNSRAPKKQEAQEPVTAHLTPAATTAALSSPALVLTLSCRGQLLYRIRSRKGSLYVGSMPYNDLVLSGDSAVCPRHAQVYQLDGRIYFELLDANATASIQGSPAQKLNTLDPGASINIGAFTLSLSQENSTG
jgi:hypothetical protein